jgi:hypothetical protein
MAKKRIKNTRENKAGLTILISIILTIILVSTVNVGISLFLGEVEYSDFCDYSKPFPLRENVTQQDCEKFNGTWYQEEGYCDFYTKCSQEYEEAMRPYNQYRFYVLAIIGFALLLTGLFMRELMIQITGLATGGILVFQGIILNLQEKGIVFVSLLAILVVFGVLAFRVINSKK